MMSMIENVKTRYIKYRESIFLAVFIAYYISLVGNGSILYVEGYPYYMALELLRDISYLMMAGIFGLNLLCGIYSRREMLIFAAGAMLMAAVTLTAAYIVPCVLWLLMFCAKDISFRRIIKYAAITCAVIMISFFVLSLFGIIEDALFKRGDGLIRHSWGFYFPTNAANLYLPLLLMYMLLRKKINLVELAALFVINCFIYETTDTKSIMFFCTVAILIYIICRLGWLDNILGKAAGMVSVIAAPLGFGAYYYCQKAYEEGNELALKLNELLSNRFKLSSAGMEAFGINIFGKKIVWSTANTYEDALIYGPYNYVDSSFMQYLYNFGVLYLIYVFILYAWFGIKALRHNNTMLTLIFILLIGHAMFDPQLMWLDFNPFLLYAFAKDDTY